MGPTIVIAANARLILSTYIKPPDPFKKNITDRIKSCQGSSFKLEYNCMYSTH